MQLNKEILRLSVPSIASNITIPLLGLADTAIVGHLGSTTYMACVSIGTLMFNVVFWLFGFIRMGTTGLTAQGYGEGSREKCLEVLQRAVFLGATIGILLILVNTPLSDLLVMLVSPEREVEIGARQYFSICILSAPAILVTLSIYGWLLGMQNTLIPMIISILVNVVNILLSVWIVFGTDSGYIGVAYGTLCANWLGCIVALVWTWRFIGGKLPKIDLRKLLRGDGIRRFFTVNTDIFLRSACIMSVSLGCGAFGARMGALTVATNAVLLQFFHFFSYFMDGLAFTAEALSGRWAGANNRPMLLKSVRYLLVWSAGVAIIFFGIYLFAGDSIVALITDNPEVEANCREYSWYIRLLPPITVLAFLFDGFYIGLTATRRMLIVTFLSVVVFFAVSFSRLGVPDNHLLWTAFLSYLFIRGILLSGCSPKIFTLKHILPT